MPFVRTVICIILVFACSSVFAQDYEILMDRVQTVGDKYELTASATISDSMALSEQGLVAKEKISSYSGKVEGVVTILEIDDKMRGNEIELIVSKCDMTLNGKNYANDLLKDGTQIIAKAHNHQKVFLVNGKQVSTELGEILGLFIPLPRQEVTDDEIFGTKERKKVGDSWDVNSSGAVHALLGDGLRVKAENIKGSIKLDEVVVLDEIKCLHLSGNMQISNVIPSLPPGMSVEEASVTAEFSGNFPVDTAMGRISETMVMRKDLVGKGKLSPYTQEFNFHRETIHSAQRKLRFLNGTI